MKYLLQALLTILGVILITGCIKTSTSNTDAYFSQQLQIISERVYDLFEETQDGQDNVNKAKMDDIIKEATIIISEFDISNKVQTSGRYSSLHFPDTKTSSSGQDVFSIVLPESSDAFQRIINNYLLFDDFVSIDNVIENPNLLDNEKLALAYMISFIQNDRCHAVKSAEECIEAYNNSMKDCKKWLYIGTGLTLASAAVSGFLTAAFAAATSLDYEKCSSNAMAEYMRCTQQ